MKSIYAAGRIEHSRLRFGAHDCTINDEHQRELGFYDFPEHRHVSAAGVDFIYTGPYTFAGNHGCAHVDYLATSDDPDDRPNGRGTRSHGDAPNFDADSRGFAHTFADVHQRALRGIEACDVFFAWLEDEKCFGTLLEIGYAKALNKTIIIGHSENINPRGELWFAFQSADRVFSAVSAAEAYRSVIQNELAAQQLPRKKRRSTITLANTRPHA